MRDLRGNDAGLRVAVAHRIEAVRVYRMLLRAAKRPKIHEGRNVLQDASRIIHADECPRLHMPSDDGRSVLPDTF